MNLLTDELIIKSEIIEEDSENVDDEYLMEEQQSSESDSDGKSLPNKKTTMSKEVYCCLCKKMYTNTREFILHSFIHSEDATFSCHLCGFKHTSGDEMERHIKVHEPSTGKYKCEICKKGFSVRKYANEHKYTHTGEKPYKCDICGQSFMFSRRLASHRRSEHYEIVSKFSLRYNCSICKKRYMSRSGIKKHNFFCHNVCETCGERFPNKEELDLHRRRHRIYDCKVCNKTFLKIKHLEDHMKEHDVQETLCYKPFLPEILTEEESTILSDEPEEISTSYKNLISMEEITIKDEEEHSVSTNISQKPLIKERIQSKRHKLIIPTKQIVKTFTFKIKPNKYSGNGDHSYARYKGVMNPIVKPVKVPEQNVAEGSKKSQLEVKPRITKLTNNSNVEVNTEKVARANTSIYCDICTFTYESNLEFALHTIIHNDDNRYSCHLCDKKFLSKHNLEYHIQEHTGASKYKCKICKKGFPSSTFAEEHKYFHTGEKPFQCDICGKNFMFSRYLASHRSSSHYEIITKKPLIRYDCTICKKHYSSGNGLKRHNLKKHNDTGIDLTVLCDICGKRLADNEKLKFHKRTHTGFKPFKCDICNKRFINSSRLTEHRRIHTGEKPYKCKFCDRGFTQIHSRSAHERTHTGERPYICRLCNKGYITKGALDMHMKSCTEIRN